MGNERKVREERTFWRDEKVLVRHRLYGFDLPCVDVDCLLCEYNHAIPAAIVELKECHATIPNFNNTSFRALKYMADKCKIPFIVVFYYPEKWCYRVYPQNYWAKKVYTQPYSDLSEREYVESLMFMRNQPKDESLLGQLNAEIDFDIRN